MCKPFKKKKSFKIEVFMFILCNVLIYRPNFLMSHGFHVSMCVCVFVTKLSAIV